MNFDFNMFEKGMLLGKGQNEVYEYHLKAEHHLKADLPKVIAVKSIICKDTPEMTMDFKLEMCHNEAFKLYTCCIHPNILKCFGFSK